MVEYPSLRGERAATRRPLGSTVSPVAAGLRRLDNRHSRPSASLWRLPQNVDTLAGQHPAIPSHRSTMAATLASLVNPTSSVVGSKLLGVTYWCLFHETSADAVLSEIFFHGGFTELRFESSTLLASWSENAGWEDHFSLGVDAAPASSEAIAGYHEPFDASRGPLWLPHLHSTLAWARILGWNRTPHVLELGFALGAVVLADGYQAPWGDGDDLVHWPAFSFWSSRPTQDLQCMWRSSLAPDLPRI